MLLRRIVLSLFVVSCVAAAQAQTLRGKVFDSNTGEPLTGATVVLEHTHYTTTVQLDGAFVFRHLPSGKYIIDVTTVGYQHSKPQEVELTADVTVNIGMTPSAITLQETTIVGSAGGSDHVARRLEQRSDMVQNILSARTIELSPDITVANAIQRVSGVTIQRDNTGDGRYAIIRGMDQRYNNTLVNGIKIPSPDDKYRFVPMNIFPSEMLERLEVIKALTPSMEGDAIGGTMNLVMKNAPDHFLLTANASGGYSTLFSSRPFTAFNHSGIPKKSPAEIHGNDYPAPATDFTNSNLLYSQKSNPINELVGLTIGDRFAGGKLGIILSASYQNIYKGSISERLVPDAQPLTAPVPNTLNPSDSYVRQFNTQTNRLGLQNKIDYFFNSRNKISLFNMYLHQNEYETRFTPDSSTAGLNSTPTQTLVSPEYRSRWQIQDIYNGTLHGEHQLSNRVKFDWNGVYSFAKQNIPDMSTITWTELVNYDASGDGKITNISNTVPKGTSNAITHRWQHNTDQDLAGYANLGYTPTLFNRLVEFQAGGLYRYKTRNNYNNEYALQALNGGAPFTNVNDVQPYFQATGDNQGSTTANNAMTYTAHEKVGSGYLQARFMLVQNLQVLGGVRVENTVDDYNTVLPETSTIGKSGTISYTDVLPSVHFKYSVAKNQNIRLSYFKSISRPGFGDLVPITDNSNDEFTFLGNPLLLHVRADNLDARYELFPGIADQFLVGAFYKKIENPIEYYVTNVNGPSSLYIKPQNSGEATNYGLEAVFTKFFGMFGVSANYTYTHSSVTTPKRLYTLSNGSIQTFNVNQTRPLQGQANNVGNISLLFKSQKIGLDVQLALAYTGDRIAQVSPYANLDIWDKPFTQLDLSLEQRLAKHFTFFGKVNNLTNAPNKEYIKFPYKTVNSNLPGGYQVPFQDAGSNYTVAQKDIYKLSFQGGIRYKF
ncbi:MAG TPA: TonB-dependent receptor [Dinghuibacter sp.]|uniref:TonB-dependent receptor n=1 Tax=Dinghuibacter sp. TaxID=2024697 RepID=UPI002CD561D4|nr:TonB-dependent receptor [Dinghuibacter sp.]HTJ12584.1 TonB-dependent receptor [Dinghuibacter sp.]